MQLPNDAALARLAESIQLAITPVFLLSGVAVFLALLNTRLTRVIDRTRVLETRHETPDDTDTSELVVLAQRRHWINLGITLCTLCALLVCIVVGLMFLGTVVHIRYVVKIVAFLFVAAMIGMIVGLLCFLREIQLAVLFFRQRVAPRMLR
jgi:hypothetical protein